MNKMPHCFINPLLFPKDYIINQKYKWNNKRNHLEN